MTERTYEMCTYCVMDTSDPDIRFDDENRCNHCRDFDRLLGTVWFPNDEGARQGRPMPEDNMWPAQCRAEHAGLSRLLATMADHPGRAVHGSGCGTSSSAAPRDLPMERLKDLSWERQAQNLKDLNRTLFYGDRISSPKLGPGAPTEGLQK